MTVLAKFTKHPEDKKRYSVDYSKWLDNGETIATVFIWVTPDTTSNFSVPFNQIDNTGTKVSFFVDGGNDRETYSVVIKMTTSAGQVKIDHITFVVSDS
jgi:hypothetical protein